MRWLLIFMMLPLVGWGQTNFCTGYTTHAPISLTGVSGQTITGLSITPVPGQALIRLTNCSNITIYNNVLNGNCLPNQDINRMGVVLVNCHDVVIRNNKITQTARGVYVTSFSGAFANIKVDSNYFQNMTGPYPAGEAVQFNGVNGAGVSVSYNKIENLPSISAPTDNINMFQSSGTPGNYNIITHNEIRCTGATSGFASGAGVIVGDGNSGSYWQVISNIVVNPSHGQFTIAGGSFNYLINNIGLTNDLTAINVVGIQANAAAQPCSNVFITGNQISCFNNPFYIPTTPVPQCVPITNTLNNYHASLTPAILPAVLIPTCSISPPSITYSPNTYIETQFQSIGTISPISTGGAVTSYTIVPTQPVGINFSTTTGQFAGTPLLTQGFVAYMVAANNAGGQSSAHITFSVIITPTNVIQGKGKVFTIVPPN